MKRMKILVEPELGVAIARRAEEEGISMAELVRRCVRAKIKPAPCELPRD